MPKKKTTTKKKEKPKAKKERYFEAIGRRKTAAARVRLNSQGTKEILLNDKSLEKYFSALELQQIVKEPLTRTDCLDRFTIVIKLKGGGLRAQAEAVRHGLSRALINMGSCGRR